MLKDTLPFFISLMIILVFLLLTQIPKIIKHRTQTFCYKDKGAILPFTRFFLNFNPLNNLLTNHSEKTEIE
jgi:hypothetical protein